VAKLLPAVVLAPFLLVVLGMALSQSAAGNAPCLTKRALPIDEQNIRIAARVKAVAIAPTLHITDFCGYESSAHVELQSPSVSTPEGAQAWWRMTCERSNSTQRGSWICDAPERHRRLELRATLGAAQRKILADLDRSISVATAREMTLKALALFEDPESKLQQCNLPDAEHSSRSWDEIRSDMRGDIDRQTIDMSVDPVDSKPGGVRVRLLFIFSIDFPAECWSEWREPIITWRRRDTGIRVVSETARLPILKADVRHAARAERAELGDAVQREPGPGG
jgi:hypothetical protein